jgi:hypothetical protein
MLYIFIVTKSMSFVHNFTQKPKQHKCDQSFMQTSNHQNKECITNNTKIKTNEKIFHRKGTHFKIPNIITHDQLEKF